MALPASSFLRTLKETLYMKLLLQQEKSKYKISLILPRSFENVVKGVNARMNKMRRSSFIRIWKHAVLGLFRFICHEKI